MRPSVLTFTPSESPSLRLGGLTQWFIRIANSPMSSASTTTTMTVMRTFFFFLRFACDCCACTRWFTAADASENGSS